ncbi:MAG TPA: alkaline phosphatase [Planctomycetes bacterium]|nr:alkaline phosphatase [Fuerstiella sp.]HIK92961.1 alkaline phosphatase [Planctomycetota bacterium]
MAPIIDRRSFLTSSAAIALTPAIIVPASGVVQKLVRFSGPPFQLGVSSGEPSADGFVIWTRLAPRPVEGGGMPRELVEVRWEVAADETFTKVVRKGNTVATPQLAHSVHVELQGLESNRWYWYRFKAGSEISPVGRTRTMPTVESKPDRLRFAFASCQHYEQGFFTAYRHMAADDLDLVIHLGDYIYEGASSSHGVRRHPGGELESLDDYRNRYVPYQTDKNLQAAHTAFPWLVTWDDHEFDNDYANHISEQPHVAAAAFLRRRQNACQAYYEHMPLRRRAIPRGPDLQLFHRTSFGRLADFFVLDTRQYRTNQPNGGGLKPLEGEVFNPNATILGRRQKGWLKSGLLQSHSTWNVLAQQVLMARVDRIPGDTDLYTMDKWAGYDVERQEMMDFFHERRIPNPIVLSGDIHTNFVNELKTDFDNPDSATVGTEFVGTSISSGGDGSQKLDYTDDMMAENPFIKFHNAERGYVRCEVTPDEWRSDYQVVESVTRKAAPLVNRASFVVTNGESGVKSA